MDRPALLYFACIFATCSASLLPNPTTDYEKTSYFTDKVKHWNTIPADINIKINDFDLNKSITFGSGVVDRLHRLETNLGWSNINVKQGSPAFARLIEYNPEFEALGQGKHALIAAKATIHLINSHCYKNHLTTSQCSKYMTKLKLDSTELKPSCDKINRICTWNERTSKYRAIDGSCNNVNEGSLGQSFTGYKRLLFPDYLDGVHEPRRSLSKKQVLPSARLISTSLVRHHDMEDSDITLAVMQWGQFIAHDLTHTAINKMIHSGGTIECCSPTGSKLSPRYVHPFCSPIIVPSNDKFYSKHNLQCMSYVRSVPAIRSDCSLGPIEQLNQATHFLDGSQIYGTDIPNSYTLRKYSHGKLTLEGMPGKQYLLSYKAGSKQCQGDKPCFASGDPRVNSQPQLTIMHTIWAREHNRIAERLSKINPQWNDETLYQEARRIVIAELQHITYNEWLQNILGKKYLSKIFSFRSYNEGVDASISNSFATAAFRFIKSLMAGELRLYSEAREVRRVIDLADHFYNSNLIKEGGVFDDLLRSMTTQGSQKSDLDYADDVINLMYGNGKTGLDIFSLDIQRGRDHGLPSYMAFRTLCGLPPVTSFEGFSDIMSAKTIKSLSQVYKHPGDIDLLVGGMSEISRDDSILGPTFSCIVADQFLRTRVGDRYFYNFNSQPVPFTGDQSEEIKKVTLARILCDNGNDIVTMQPNVFRSISRTNNLVDCSSLPKMNLYAWKDTEFGGT